MPEIPEKPRKTVEEIADEAGLYPVDAFHFVGAGLNYTVQKLKGDIKDPDASRHITGRELSEGLRQFALMQWGMLARTVLSRWNIHRTEDFGRIVFLLVENDWLSKTETDSEADFKDVFDFDSAFGHDSRIEAKP
ncbi:MAG: Minf_1886 family protein [Tepidisphaerales bacterium]